MGDARPLIEAAIAHAGSETKLGAACGVSQNAIWSAKKKGRVSADPAVAIERATNGKIPRWQLRPDLWGPPSPTIRTLQPAEAIAP